VGSLTRRNAQPSVDHVAVELGTRTRINLPNPTVKCPVGIGGFRLEDLLHRWWSPAGAHKYLRLLLPWRASSTISAGQHVLANMRCPHNDWLLSYRNRLATSPETENLAKTRLAIACSQMEHRGNPAVPQLASAQAVQLNPDPSGLKLA
jgi:hypothetical protein